MNRFSDGLYTPRPPNIFKSCDIKAEKRGAACGTNVGEKKCTRNLKGKPTGIRLFGRPSCRWLILIGWEVVVILVQNRNKGWATLNSVMKLQGL
jgi:hypothetical protein